MNFTCQQALFYNESCFDGTWMIEEALQAGKQTMLTPRTYTNPE